MAAASSSERLSAISATHPSSKSSPSALAASTVCLATSLAASLLPPLPPSSSEHAANARPATRIAAVIDFFIKFSSLSVLPDVSV